MDSCGTRRRQELVHPARVSRAEMRAAQHYLPDWPGYLKVSSRDSFHCPKLLGENRVIMPFICGRIIGAVYRIGLGVVESTFEVP